MERWRERLAEGQGVGREKEEKYHSFSRLVLPPYSLVFVVLIVDRHSKHRVLRFQIDSDPSPHQGCLITVVHADSTNSRPGDPLSSKPEGHSSPARCRPNPSSHTRGEVPPCTLVGERMAKWSMDGGSGSPLLSRDNWDQ